MIPESQKPIPAGTLTDSAPPVRPDFRKDRFTARWLAFLLGILTLAVYWPAIHHDYINFDDEDYVTENRHVESGLSLQNVAWAFTTFRAANWHPLTWISLMLDVSLFGKNAAGMHFTNVLLHAANVVLLFWLLRRLTGAEWRSALVAAFFAWHPLHVESVAWVAERKDVLSGFFGFLTLLFYARYAQLRERGAESNRPLSSGPGKAMTSYWLALLAFALGLLSKSMLVTWPCVMLLLDYWPLERFKPGRVRALIGEKLPFFALTVGASAVTFLVQRHQGAVVAGTELPFSARLGNAMISYCGYLGKLGDPTRLAVFYPHPGNWPVGEIILAAIFLLGVSAVFWIQRNRHPVLLVGWLWYCGTLVPVIGLIQVGRQSMADRYTYLPSVGIFIILVWGIYALARRRRHTLVEWALVAGLPLVLCIAITRHQLAYWQNSETLFRHTLAVTTDNFVGHFNLGIALEAEGHIDEAIREYQETIRLQPNVAAVRNNLGAILVKKHRLDEALAQFREAIRLLPDYGLAHENAGAALLEQGHPEAALKEYTEGVRLETGEGAPLAHYNMGVGLAGAGQTNAALREFALTLQLQPDYLAARINLIHLLAQTGQTEEEISELEKMLRFNPGDTNSLYDLGLIFLNTGKLDDAIRELQTDLQFAPDDADAHYHLGQALLKREQAEAAIAQFQAAFRRKTYSAEIHYNLGNALLAHGQMAAAIGEFQEAVHLQPDNAEAHNNLGNLLARAGKTDEAINELQAALRIKPDDASTHYNLGNILLKTAGYPAAIAQFKEAIRLKPSYAPGHYNLGVALDKNGQPAAAIAEFAEAVRLQPDYAIAHNSLGVAWAAQGRLDDAIKEFQEALRIKPDYTSAQRNLANALAAQASAKP